MPGAAPEHQWTVCASQDVMKNHRTGRYRDLFIESQKIFNHRSIRGACIAQADDPLHRSHSLKFGGLPRHFEASCGVGVDGNHFESVIREHFLGLSTLPS